MRRRFGFHPGTPVPGGFIALTLSVSLSLQPAWAQAPDARQ
ncbi:MAG: hypothetical protein ACP5UT_01535 [Bryobacteraceae bacterium]